MQPFKTFTGIIAAMDRANVDTDAIIPKQFLKSIKRTGFGANLFDAWRYRDSAEAPDGQAGRETNPDFVLNQPPYDRAQILLARENFGCGSSREHAVWALTDFGFKAALAPAFADIFYSNSLKNGFLPICLKAAEIDELFNAASATRGLQATVDLAGQYVRTATGRRYDFAIDAGMKDRLLKGQDDISLTLELAREIRAYEKKQKAISPWLFKGIAE